MDGSLIHLEADLVYKDKIQNSSYFFLPLRS